MLTSCNASKLFFAIRAQILAALGVVPIYIPLKPAWRVCLSTLHIAFTYLLFMVIKLTRKGEVTGNKYLQFFLSHWRQKVLWGPEEGLMMVNKNLNTCHTSEHQDDNAWKSQKAIQASAYMLCIPLLLFWVYITGSRVNFVTHKNAQQLAIYKLFFAIRAQILAELRCCLGCSSYIPWKPAWRVCLSTLNITLHTYHSWL